MHFSSLVFCSFLYSMLLYKLNYLRSLFSLLYWIISYTSTFLLIISGPKQSLVYFSIPMICLVDFSYKWNHTFFLLCLASFRKYTIIWDWSVLFLIPFFSISASALTVCLFKLTYSFFFAVSSILSPVNLFQIF